jgi:hypothetical protein
MDNAGAEPEAERFSTPIGTLLLDVLFFCLISCVLDPLHLEAPHTEAQNFLPARIPVNGDLNVNSQLFILMARILNNQEVFEVIYLVALYVCNANNASSHHVGFPLIAKINSEKPSW